MEERERSDDGEEVDVSELDKRRQVVGQRDSAGAGRQIATYAVAVAVVLGAGFGIMLLVDDLDKAPAKAAGQAPWTGNDRKPKPLE